MRWLRIVAVVTMSGLRAMPQRWGASLAALVGVAGVVAVMVAVLSIAEGFSATMRSTGSDDTVLIMRGGTDTEMNSILTLDDARMIGDAPGIARTERGAAASAELLIIVDVPKRSTGTDANVPVRGVQASAFDVRQELTIVDGRNFESGRNEMIAGRGAAVEFAGLEVGGVLRFGDTDWTVVGIFEDGGALTESELWCDGNVLRPAFDRGNFVQSVYARLEDASRFDAFKDALTTDPRLDVKVEREAEYYAEQSRTLTTIISTLGFLVAGLMAIGAVFGAVNTMNAAVASRTREIATLRALGFGGGPVVVSVLFESLLLATVGGAIGGFGAWAVFDGYRAATLNWDSFSQVTFAFAVTPALLLQGIVWALLMGLIGGLIPAIRAARTPVASALREL